MGPSLKHRSITEFAAMSAEDRLALLVAARELQCAAQRGLMRRVLRGRNVALLCSADDGSSGAAAMFGRAASQLGARVAEVRCTLGEASPATQIDLTARVLGRLYDGIDCIGMSAGLVQRIGVGAGVPVFEAISSGDHPMIGLADLLALPMAIDDRRCAVMQAVLIAAIVA